MASSNPTDLFPWQYARRVAFGDTDMAGVVHFSRLLCYVEEAEHALLEALGIPVAPPEGCWPRAGIEARFYAPARYGENLIVALLPATFSRSTVTWSFHVSAAEDRRLAEGRITTCHARLQEGARFKPAPLPRRLRTPLARALHPA